MDYFDGGLSFAIVDIEDMENWHGKPIPKDLVGDLLKDLQKEIQVPNKKMTPELPVEDAAPADHTPIVLSKPPAYALGDKVTAYSEPQLFMSCWDLLPGSLYPNGYLQRLPSIWRFWLRKTLPNLNDLICLLTLLLLPTHRWQPGVHTARPWPSSESPASVWWPWTETPRTLPSQTPSGRHSPTATSSASSPSRTW